MTNNRHAGGTWKRHRVALVGAIVRMQLNLRLEGVYLDSTGFEPDPSTVDVWVANHTSRYDGFLIWKTKHSLDPSGRLFTVMLSESLRRYSVFDGAGALGLAPGSLSSVRSMIRFVERVPAAGDGLVVFPQGRIYPGDKEPLQFRAITRVAARTGPPARFIPCAVAVEMLDRKRPTAFLRIGQIIPADAPGSVARVEESVASAVRSLRKDLSIHGEELPRAWEGLRRGRATCIRLN